MFPILNIQPTEKQSLGYRSILDVHSLFYTIQGEGPFAGRPAIFIRLAGCNLQCPMCDTDYTDGRYKASVPGIVGKVYSLAEHLPKSNPPLVVITGGEPFRQYLSDLIIELLGEGFPVQIETNGTLYQELPWCDELTIVCSPKTGALNKHLVPHIDAFKYVLDADSVSSYDGLPLSALGHPNSGQVARPPAGFSGTIYLQPIDDHKATPLNNFMTEHLAACVKSCMAYGYTLGLQLHKYLNLP